MILQTSAGLDAAINKNGCYFMAILYLSSQRTGRSYFPQDILRLKGKSIEQGYLRENCFVDDPDGIFELAGVQTRYTDRHESPDRDTSPDEIEILYYRWQENGHFVAGVSGVVAYDPMGRSRAVQYGVLRSKRVFKINR